MDVVREFKMQDFAEMEELERKYYDEEYIASAADAYEWYKHEPTSVIAIKNYNRIIAFMNIVAVPDEVYQAIYTGVFNDKEMGIQHILKVSKIKDCEVNLFLSCLVVDGSYRNQGLVKRLLKEYYNLFSSLSSHNGVSFRNIITDNVTDEGVAFSERYHFEFVKNSNHQSKVYVLPYKNLFSAFLNA